MTRGQILDEVRRVGRDICSREAESVDREGRWPEASVRALQRAGLGGLVIPQSKGGLGQGLFGLAQVCEIVGTDCASTALCFGMHCVGAAVIAAKATADQQERYLQLINAGQHLTTLALSEPGTGIHFYLPQTQLIKESQETFVVTGTKAFVSNGGYADSYVVSTVAAEPEASPGNFSCVVIEEDTKGVSWGNPWNGLGMRGNSSRRLELRNVRVSHRNLLGEEGDQLWYIFEVVAPYFLMAMAGTYLGVAGAALEEAKRHMTERRYSHTGSTLGGHPVLQHRLGMLWAELERTRRLVYYAGMEGDAQGPNSLPALVSAKAEAGDCAVHIANEAMTLMGGKAYEEGTKIYRLLRDARAAHVMAPTTDILRTWAGRAILGLPLLAD